MEEPNIQVPEKFANVPGVQLNAPPPDLIGPISSMLEKASKGIPAGKNATLMFVAHRHEGQTKMNFAFVTKNDNDTLRGIVWVGKNWGKPIEVGIAAQLNL